MTTIDFTFSDTIAGYVTGYDDETDSFGLRTSDGREFQAYFTKNTYSQAMRNFGEAYLDTTGQMREMLVPDRHLFAYGIFYPGEGDGLRFEVKSIIFPAIHGKELIFEQPRWWVNQARFIGDFYLRGQFPDGNYDWRNYRTKLSLSGTHTPDYIAPDFRQETDTISRLVYGLATAYLLTGEDRFLQAAESGTEYLREHMRATNEAEGIVFWYHGIDVSGNSQRKIFTSEFGDDYDAIPMYEQIYALAGPTQTYRITGDPRILSDIEKTITLFDRFYRDPEKGGYFSHLDPINLDPRSDALRSNRARKNWNSVGDHAPAYLINAVIATGRKDLEDFLVQTGDTIAVHFPDDVHSPFVQERFHEDWSHDRKWGWQQDSAVIGHNLKIAWNLMRIHHLRPNDEYVALANKIADTMPAVGSDQQRGGWYDVVERRLEGDQKWHRFVWHDRKAWWQQEQAILAYYILAGSLGHAEHTRLARESAAFYSAHFLDHDEGGIYFNVLASGIPFLVGNERLKGSHSMSGYHSMELCYLAAVYTNLLVNEEDLELYFKPKAVNFPDGILRVSPDLLPPGSVRLSEVWVNDVPYADFDADALTVKLPPGEECRVKVRIMSATDKFDSQYSIENGKARIVMRGKLDPDEVIKLRRDLDRVVATQPQQVVLVVKEVESISRQGMNEMLFFRSKVPMGTDVYVVGACEGVAASFVEIGDAEAAGGDFCRVDDESEDPGLTEHHPMVNRTTDAIIVGAGPAGLSAAIYLARYDRTVVVFDAGHGRSTHHQINHNYLGFPGGVPAAKLRELGRAQLAEYPQVDFEHHKVRDMRREGDEFVAEGQFGAYTARVVIICTGVLDHYPHFHGWESYVGTSMFWCITCDGYASKGKNILVIGHTNGAAGEAVQLSRFSNRLTLLTNSHSNEIEPRYLERLAKFRIPVVHDKIERAVGTDGQFRSVLTSGGLEIELDALFCTQGATPEVQLATDLGVSLFSNGYIDTDIEQRTNIPGVYAAGDVTRIHGHQITTAVHEGATAASAANYYLYPPELKAD